VVPFVDRSSLKPVSLFALSFQDSWIWLDERVVAARFVGAAGGAVGVGLGDGAGGAEPATIETSFEGRLSEPPLL